MPAILILAAQIIPLLIQAGIDIAPTLARLFNADPNNVSQDDWDFLHEQRAKALAVINDTSKDV